MLHLKVNLKFSLIQFNISLVKEDEQKHVNNIKSKQIAHFLPIDVIENENIDRNILHIQKITKGGCMYPTTKTLKHPHRTQETSECKH